MSTTEYIPSITNRSSHNVEQAKKNPNSFDTEATMGAWNFDDMNRVINNLRYASECMLENQYFIETYELVSKADWNEKDIITQEKLRNLVTDHMTNLRSYITEDTVVPNWTHITSILNMDYNFANSLEKNIDLLAEAKPEITKIKVDVINGTGSGEYRVGELITITKDDPYSYFKSEDLTASRVEKVHNDGSWDWCVPYHPNKTVTVECVVNKKYILTVVTHDMSETYELSPGETIPIDAHMTTTSKSFVCWNINDRADNNLRYLFKNQNAETTQFTMIDKDVTISAEYRDAQPPIFITVLNGLGTGWYPSSTPAKLGTGLNIPIRSTLPVFNHWAGSISSSLTSSKNATTYTKASVFFAPNTAYGIEAIASASGAPTGLYKSGVMDMYVKAICR